MLGVVVLILGFFKGTIKKDERNIKVRVKHGFIVGFVATFIFITLFALYYVYVEKSSKGTFLDFILWNLIVSFIAGIIFSLIKLVPFDTKNFSGSGYLTARLVVGLFGIGLFILGIIFIK